MNDRKEVLFQARRQDNAGGCAVTVITDPHLAVHRGLLARALRRLFPTACAIPAGDTRYDLLAVPNLDEVIDDGVRFELLVDDVLTTLDAGQADKCVAVITEEGTQTRLLEKLAAEPKLAGVSMRGGRVPSRRTMPGGLLALTCPDWRLHGRGGFIRQVQLACGRRVGGVMTIPGAAKDINIAAVHGRVAAALLYDLAEAGFRRLLIVSHADCGRYGGSGAFGSEAEERARLSGDLRQAAAFLAMHLNLEIDIGIAEISGTGTGRIVSVEPAGALKIGSS